MVRGIKWPGTANLVVSLLALHKGEWNGPRMLDNQPVETINTFFEEGENLGAPNSILENHDRVFQGSIFLGDGFLLSREEAGSLRASDPRNAEVIMPIINGKELNNEPNQAPGRRSDCLLHDLFRLPAAVGQSCNTTSSSDQTTRDGEAGPSCIPCGAANEPRLRGHAHDPEGAGEVGERFGWSATDSVHQQAVRGGCMRRRLLDPTHRSPASF